MFGIRWRNANVTETAQPVVHPPDWSSSDALLERMLAAEDRHVRLNRRLMWLAFTMVGLVIAALLMSLIALNRDIESVARAAPKDDSVGSAALQAGAVTPDKLADGAVTPRAVAAGAIWDGALADGSVSSRAVALGNITEPLLGDGAVSSRAVALGNITEPLLGDGAVSSRALALGAVTEPLLGDGAVSRRTIAGGAVTNAAIGNDAVSTRVIADRSITNPLLADESVGPNKLRPGAVNGSKVASDSLTGANIDESTLARVPSSATASNALELGGAPPTSYVAGVTVTTQASARNDGSIKQVLATCPTGRRVIGGGAGVQDGNGGVAIVQSIPSGRASWSAVAESFDGTSGAWRLVVTVICAAGGATS